MTPVLPLLRGGRWYRSMDTAPVPGGGQLCLAPEIIVRDDAARLRASAPVLPDRPRRLELLRAAVELFRHGRVPIEGAGTQDPGEFAASLRETSGLPPALVRRWSDLLAERLEELDPDESDGITLVSLPANTFTCLEAVLEAALSGAAVWVRPSRREPLSSARLIGALLSAGWPPRALGHYPSAPRTLRALVQVTDRQIVYGGEELAAELDRWGAGPELDLRGPGRAVVIVDGPPDPGELAGRIASDAGRFCTNACVIACLDGAEPIGRQVAEVLDGIALDPPDPRWPQASWPEPEAARVAESVLDQLSPGGRLLTGRPILSRAGGATFLAPALVQVDDVGHPLVGRELPFPFAVVVATDPAGVRLLSARSRFVHPARSAHSEGVPS